MSLLEACFLTGLEEEVSPQGHCSQWYMPTVSIESNCQKTSILEKLVDEEQCIFKPDQYFTDQTQIF